MNEDMYLTDEEIQARDFAKSKDEIIRLKRENGLKKVLASADSRAWLNSILDACGIYQQTFTGEPMMSAFNEGCRSIGLRIYADIIAADESKILTLMKDNRNDR